MTKPALADRPLTIEEFFQLTHTIEGRAELVNGRVQMMSGGTRRHDRVSGDVFAALRSRLRGTSCVPTGPNLGIEVEPGAVRYPDAAISCDPRDLDQPDAKVMLHRYPKVIFEVFSPSTSSDDRLIKLHQYKSMDSVDTIVLIDSTRSYFDTYERAAPNEWRNITHLPGATLTIRDSAITIPAEEIFADT